MRATELEESHLRLDDYAEEVLAVHEAMDLLERANERLARVVELRYFAGLSVEEVAGMLEVTPRTVNRDWRKARAFLKLQLGIPRESEGARGMDGAP